MCCQCLYAVFFLLFSLVWLFFQFFRHTTCLDTNHDDHIKHDISHPSHAQYHRCLLPLRLGAIPFISSFSVFVCHCSPLSLSVDNLDLSCLRWQLTVCGKQVIILEMQSESNVADIGAKARDNDINGRRKCATHTIAVLVGKLTA